MKNKKSINWLIALFVISSVALTQNSYYAPGHKKNKAHGNGKHNHDN